MVPLAAFEPITGLLVEDGAIDAAIVFGSTARGTQRPDSDLDVAVLFRTPRDATAARWTALVGRLAAAGGRAVHLVEIETADAGLRRKIFAEGVVLFDSNPERTRQLKIRTLLEYFDWAHALSVIDQGHRRRLARARAHG